MLAALKRLAIDTKMSNNQLPVYVIQLLMKCKTPTSNPKNYTPTFIFTYTLTPHIIYHVEDAAVSGSVHSFIGRNKHCQGSWTSQRRGRPAVLQKHM